MEDRYAETLAITSAARTADDGYGGIAPATASTVVAAYKCMAWPPSMFKAQMARTAYGLSENVTLRNFVGAYNASIRAGMFATDKASVKWKILTADAVNGSDGNPVRMAILGTRVEA